MEPMSWPKRLPPLRKIVIADAGPLIAFARINQLVLLTQVFEGVLVTEEVFNECTMRTDFPETKVIHEAFHNKLLQRCDTPTLHFELALCVDVGEASAIAVALELGYGLFGQTTKEWREANPDARGNVRDNALLEQLVVLTNLESLNAVLIRQGLTQADRLNKLNEIAISQMRTLLADNSMKRLK